ncbi:DNA clamp loader, partial [Wallemia mellicola]
SLYVDKYRPKSLDELDYHHDITNRIRSLARSGDFPHLLFYGPSGAGRKTRIMCTLRELFGQGVEKLEQLKIDQRVFLTPSNRKLDVNIVQSNYHIEITPSDVGQYDRIIIQDILKEIAQTQQIDANAKHKFKVVIINEADQLSRDAQAALRRTMEKYMANLRIILCAQTTSKIISPIRSRCLLMRIPAPQPEQMTIVLNHVAKKERFQIPDDVAQQIGKEATGNLRKALLVLEAMRMQSPNFDMDIQIAKPDWQSYTISVAKDITSDPSPEGLLKVRGKVYELITHCIPPTLILKTLLEVILNMVDDSIRADLIYWAAFYEHRMRQGSKQIFHLEAFIAKTMRSKVFSSSNVTL